MTSHRNTGSEMIARHIPVSALLAFPDGNRERTLERDEGGHHFPPHAKDHAMRQHALMTGQKPPQNPRFAFGAEKHRIGAAFRIPDPGNEIGPLHDQIVQRVVDFVDLDRADRTGCRPCSSFGGRHSGLVKRRIEAPRLRTANTGPRVYSASRRQPKAKKTLINSPERHSYLVQLRNFFGNRLEWRHPACH